MEKEKFTVAILGVGGRGGYAYGTLINEQKDKFEIISLCDINKTKLDFFAKKFNVNETFTDENEFFAKKRADVLIVATQDKDHYRHAMKAFSLGYDILLEKPITSKRQELDNLLEMQKKTNCKALVCHVFRYAPPYRKMNEILKSGDMGRLIGINAIEQVGALHQAQAYVRGHWRREEDSSPMILAKCSHDLDLIRQFANSHCKKVWSIGDLYYFKEENAPKNSSIRCIDCELKDTCQFSAKTEYLDHWIENGRPTDGYPYNVPCLAPITEEKVMDALKNSSYGKCVFHSDNDVVDHQVVQMTFENNVVATLTMTAFASICARKIELFCTLGHISFNEVEGTIRVCKHGIGEEIINMKDLVDRSNLHGGGDVGLVEDLYDMLSGKAAQKTSLEVSAESHYIGFAAEESRKKGGIPININ